MSAIFPQYSAALVAALLAVSALAGATGATTAAPDASFQQSVAYADRGDVVTVTLDVSQASTVNLGSPEQGFWLQVDVGENTNVLHLNTYRAAREGVPTDEMVWTTDGSIRDRRLRTDRLSQPLEAAEYTMNITVNGIRQDLGNFVVEDRTTGGLDARVAPHDVGVDSLGPDRTGDVATPIPDNGTIARGDWLVLWVNATGLTGTASKGSGLNGVRADVNGTAPSEVFGEPGIDISFEQVGHTMNVEPNEFGADAVERLVRAPDRGFYAFVDTGEHGVSAGDRYNVTFSISEDSRFGSGSESVSTEFRVVERRVDLQYEGDRLVVENETTIRANTTFAPGTTVNVTAEDDDVPPLYEHRMDRVGDDGSFAVTFDFRDLEPGREFELHLRDQREVHDAVVGPVPTETPEPTTTEPPNTTADPETTAPNTTTVPDTTTETPTETTTPDTTKDGLTQVSDSGDEGPLTQRTLVEGSSGGGVPGFDAVLGVVAVVAAGLLALRRS